MTDQAQAVRTRSELEDAIRAFTDPQWARLRKVAAHYAPVAGCEDVDLLQEAFRRALDGERNCPVTIDPVRFLAEAMRSIANGDFQKAKRQPTLVPLISPGDDETTGADPPDPAPNAEERLAGDDDRLAARRAELVGLFSDDTEAQIIVEGLIEGMRGEELRALTDLDPTQYQSKRRLIRRRIEKHY